MLPIASSSRIGCKGEQNAPQNIPVCVRVSLYAVRCFRGVLAQDNSVLRVAATASVTTWDPSLSFSTEALYLTNIYEPLLCANPPGSAEAFRPALATDWSASDDGMTWTFHIRAGRQIPRWRNAQCRSRQGVRLDRHKAMGGASFIWAPVASIDVVDDYTVQINMAYPAPLELIASSLYDAWIVSPKALRRCRRRFDLFRGGRRSGNGTLHAGRLHAGQRSRAERLPRLLGRLERHQPLPEHRRQHRQRRTCAGAASERQTRSTSRFSLPRDQLPRLRRMTRISTFTPSKPSSTTSASSTRPARRSTTSWCVRRFPTPSPTTTSSRSARKGEQPRRAAQFPRACVPYSEDVPQYHQDLDKARELLTQAGHEGGGFDAQADLRR